MTAAVQTKAINDKQEEDKKEWEGERSPQMAKEAARAGKFLYESKLISGRKKKSNRKTTI